MAGPYLPIVSLNHSQSIRIGSGAGTHVPNPFNASTATGLIPQTGVLNHAFYADLSDATVRRDLQRHATLGAIMVAGVPTQTVFSDLYESSDIAVTAGTGMKVNVAAGQIASRIWGTTLTTTAKSGASGLAIAAAGSGDRVDLVVVDASGVPSIVTGVAGSAVVFEVLQIKRATTTVSSGTYVLNFTWAGNVYTTAAIDYAALPSAVATAMIAATGSPSGTIPAGGFVGSGAAVAGGTGVTTITAAKEVEGPLTSLGITPTFVGGGTYSFTEVTAGVDSTAATPAYPVNYLTVATVLVPDAAASSAEFTITDVAVTA